MPAATEHPPLQLQGRAGQPLVIALAGMPAAGLAWQAPAAPAGCTLVEGPATPQGGAVGGPASQRFTLTCPMPGRHSLRFTLKRPWEDKLHAVQPVQVDIV